MLASFAVYVAAWAVPAKPGLLTIEQPDGRTIKVRIVGDENSHYYLSEDGYLLTRGADDYFYYSDFDRQSGLLRSTGVRASDISLRDSEEAAFVSRRSREAPDLRAMSRRKSTLVTRRRTANADESQTNSGTWQKTKDFPTIGTQRTIVILVQFKDTKFTVENSEEVFRNFMMQEGFTYSNGAHLSVRDYYTTCSDGLFDPQFDVFGPVTLSQNLAYYGRNDASGNDDRPEDMVVEACTMLDDEINFADYDRNGDGWVDNVYLFYAGYSEAEGASANAIWPHSWDIWLGAQIRLQLDGVNIGPYGCSPELNMGTDDLAGIGVFCHEFGHVLGLPDLYATDGNQLAFTPGEYSLMDAGEYTDNSNTPPSLTAYERWVLGWHTPDLIDRPMNGMLPPLSSGTTRSYMIPTSNPNEMFFLENRQQEGLDEFIPGHGMLVWHVDYDEEIWTGNDVNNLSTHQRVDIVEADADQSEATRAADPFPGTSGIRSFTASTYPALEDWSGQGIDLPITGIREEDGVIYFEVLGGVFEIDPVTLNEPENVTATSVSLSWTTVAHANNYLLNLYEKNGQNKTYVLQNFPMGNVTEYVVTGLEPETVYYMTVSASDGEHLSAESNEVSATTREPDFSFYMPTALPATEIGENAFTANWESLSEASEYFVSVYERNNSGEQTENLDFTDGQEGIPDTWTTNCNSFIMTPGCYGAAAPALRMAQTGSYIESPLYDGEIREISFWYKGDYMGTDNIASVSISRDGSSWEVLDFLSIADGADHYVIYGEGQSVTLPEGTCKFRIYYEKPLTGESTNGFVYFDDLRVAVEGHDNPIPVEGFVGKSAGASLSCEVSGLKPGTDYYYTVYASDGTLQSLESQPVYVRTSGDSGICDPALADGFRAVGGKGCIGIEAQAGATVRVYSTTGVVVASLVMPSSARQDVGIAPGVYLVGCGSEVEKVIVSL